MEADHLRENPQNSATAGNISSLEEQGGPTRDSKVFNLIIQMEADHLRENPQTRQQQETVQTIT